MRIFHDDVVHMQLVQIVDELAPAALLNGLATIIAEAQVHRRYSRDRIKHGERELQRPRRQFSCARTGGREIERTWPDGAIDDARRSTAEFMIR